MHKIKIVALFLVLIILFCSNSLAIDLSTNDVLTQITYDILPFPIKSEDNTYSSYILLADNLEYDGHNLYKLLCFYDTDTVYIKRNLTPTGKYFASLKCYTSSDCSTPVYYDEYYYCTSSDSYWIESGYTSEYLDNFFINNKGYTNISFGYTTLNDINYFLNNILYYSSNITFDESVYCYTDVNGSFDNIYTPLDGLDENGYIYITNDEKISIYEYVQKINNNIEIITQNGLFLIAFIVSLVVCFILYKAIDNFISF